MIIKQPILFIIFMLLQGCTAHQSEKNNIEQKNVVSTEKKSSITQNKTTSIIPGYTPCVEFDKQEYCLKWSSADGSTTNEYLRADETIDAWTRMITFKTYAGTKELKDVLPGYMQAVRPLLALKPEFLGPKVKKHKDEMILLLLLLAPDKSHYEYVVHRVYTDKGGPVKSAIFSLRIPFSHEVSFNEVMNNRGAWIKELGRLDLPAISRIPEP